jgi:hypothetical protein
VAQEVKMRSLCIFFSLFFVPFSFPVGEFGQVDSVAIDDNYLQASLSSNLGIAEFALGTGEEKYSQAIPGEASDVMEVAGNRACVMGSTLTKAIVLSCYQISPQISPPALLFRTEYNNSFAVSIQLSNDGSLVALGLNNAVKKDSTVLLLDTLTGKIEADFPCSVEGKSSVFTELLTADSALNTLGFTCVEPVVGGKAEIVIVDTKSKKILLNVPTSPSDGTGFALSNDGKYFAYGIGELTAYQRVGEVFEQLFVSNPVNPNDSRYFFYFFSFFFLIAPQIVDPNRI